MGKNKLSKFADMATFPHVFEYPFSRLQNEAFPMTGRWHEDFFRNDRPIVLELGCGRGEYTVGLARLFPEKNFIGVDIKGSRMWTGAKQVLEEGLTNAAFLRTQIEWIDRFFAPGEVSEVWLTFSDPQMKKPTKRLTSTYFMERYRRFLKDGGLIHVKTDSNFLYTYTRLMLRRNGLVPLSDSNDIYGEEFARTANGETRRILSIQTYYEQQWRNRGLSIKYLCYPLPQNGELLEPEEEIEMDSYRSYNRNKRSALSTRK